MMRARLQAATDTLYFSRREVTLHDKEKKKENTRGEYNTSGICRGFKMAKNAPTPVHVRLVGLADSHRYDLPDVRKSNSSSMRE